MINKKTSRNNLNEDAKVRIAPPKDSSQLGAFPISIPNQDGRERRERREKKKKREIDANLKREIQKQRARIRDGNDA